MHVVLVLLYMTTLLELHEVPLLDKRKYQFSKEDYLISHLVILIYL